MTTPSTDAPGHYPGRLFLVLGLALAALGVIGYVLQVQMSRLTTPWYLPCSATLAVVLVVVAMWRRRTVWRVLALLLVLLLAGAEWSFLVATRLPAYTGPLAAGKSFPPFTTVRANDMPFTQGDLEGEQNNVLVFFRGRW